MQQTAVKQGWHIANWGTWGWLETGVKFIGILVGYAAFFASASAQTLTFGGNPELGAVILLALLTLGIFGAMFMRIRQQEIISLVFAVLNFLGHAGMLIALLRTPELTSLGIAFGVLFVIGELVKQRFLVVSGYTEAGQKTPGMVNFSRGLMSAYALFVVALLI